MATAFGLNLVPVVEGLGKLARFQGPHGSL